MPQYQLPGEDTKPLAIVGGGFAGTAALLHTILKATDDPAVDNNHPLRITLVERHPQQKFGGVAYGHVPNHDHRLNLSSKRITPFYLGKPPAGFPTFDDYLSAKAVEDPSYNNDFANPRRAVFGNYLEHLIDIALEKAGGKVKVDTRYAEVTSFDDRKPGDAVLYFKDGSELPVMHAILAVGNKDPAHPRFVFNIVSNANYLDSAYSGQANTYFKRVTEGPGNNKKAAALVIGTGLSAMDNAIRLLEGGYKGKVVMMSRHGEMHPVYSADGVELKGLLKGENRPEKLAELKQTEPGWLSYVDRASDFNHLLRRMEVEFRQLQKRDFSVEEIMDHWESFNDRVFARFPTEAVNYLAANKTALNVMRVGTVPEVMGKLQEYIKAGQLEVVPGDIEDIEAKGKGKFVAKITPNNDDGQHTGPTREFHFTHVLNGIGFDNRYDLKPGSMKDPLWKHLEETKGFKSHITHAGIEVTNDFTMVKGDGTPYNNITVIGVPVAGHMTLTPHNYAEKPGRGTRLAAFTLNIAGTLSGVLDMLADKYDRFRELQQQREQEAPGLKRTVGRQYSPVRV